MNTTAENPPPNSDAPSRGWWITVQPVAGAAVMATGIVSVGLHLVGRDVLSGILLGLAAALWLLLAAAFALTLLNDRSQWTLRAATPPALAGVAATCVLGTRISQLGGGQDLATALLAVAALVWPVLLVDVLRHWKHGMPGGVFLVCVSTQGLAVLAATLAAAGTADWLAPAALAAFCLGLALYVAALAHFDLRQVLTGAGDQWVAGGALAISALAAAKLITWPDWSAGLQDALRATTWVLLALALAWYAVLLLAELRRPRPRYDVRRWATVFPLGMTAVAALTAAGVTRTAWVHTLGEVLLWIATAAWALTTAAFLTATARKRRPHEAGQPVR
ncbi:hypothetical protein [Kitasatospora sp. NPDC090091]|uniref:SLAC1 family transporter n=1 Tax=Kitasatospora sp. NPDC090091 TaxID=3364081 RepID=UPI0037FC4CAE